MEDFKKSKLDKKTIWTIVIAIYIFASAVFIVYVFYQNFKINYIDKSYSNGQDATIAQIITQAEDTSCSPFYVYTATKKVQLINTACLAASTESNANANQ